MNLQNREKAFRNLTRTIIGIFTISACCLILTSCEKDELFYMKKKITKDQIASVAKKYGIPIEFYDMKEKGDDISPSIEELEIIFSSYKRCREKPFKKTFLMSTVGDKIVFQTVRKTGNPGLLLLKSGNVEGGLWSKTGWYYDLTWLNVDVSWQDDGDKSCVNVSSNYHGLIYYKYEQDNFAYKISGDTIFFDISGTQSMTFGFDHFGIHFSDDVNSSGWVNKKTGEGSLNIDKSKYWF